ncbi:MAG: 50S ribosomal protein L21 [Fimbriimonadales bacterium]
MYAIVRTGGQQFKVQDGDVITVNKMEGDAGAKVEIKEVLMTGGDNSTVGSPFVVGASVEAEIVRQKKAKKINGFNFKAKKNVRKRWGHRALLTELKITKISAGK